MKGSRGGVENHPGTPSVAAASPHGTHSPHGGMTPPGRGLASFGASMGLESPGREDPAFRHRIVGEEERRKAKKPTSRRRGRAGGAANPTSEQASRAGSG